MRGGLVYPKSTLYSDILGWGLSSGLQFCIDCGDPASYDGSSQGVTDRSTNVSNLNRGTSSGAEASDPTFNGTAGRHFNDTYFSFDGGDYFTFTGANPTWLENIHKAAASISIFALIYPPAAGANPLIGDNGGSSSTTGFFFESNGAGLLTFFVSKSVGGTPALNVNGDTAPTRSAWNIVGVSNNNGAGSFLYLNGNYDTVSAANTYNGAYATPSAGAATNTGNLMAYGGGGGPTGSGARLAAMAIWNTALTKANFDSLFSSQRRRLGI